jgi:hypothetical protein
MISITRVLQRERAGRLYYWASLSATITSRWKEPINFSSPPRLPKLIPEFWRPAIARQKYGNFFGRYKDMGVQEIIEEVEHQKANDNSWFNQYKTALYSKVNYFFNTSNIWIGFVCRCLLTICLSSFGFDLRGAAIVVQIVKYTHELSCEWNVWSDL